MQPDTLLAYEEKAQTDRHLGLGPQPLNEKEGPESACSIKVQQPCYPKHRSVGLSCEQTAANG